MGGWNFADVWNRIARKLPDAPALVQGDRRLTWAEMNARANGVGQYLLDAGAKEQDKVALYLYNCPEYMEATFAAFKAGLVPFNTNYRYLDDELVYLFDNADAFAVIFHGAFADRVAEIMDRTPSVQLWLWVDDGSGDCPDWATPYETAANTTAEDVNPPWGRDGDNLLMIYTGGTTGRPKGVMWRQDDLIRALLGGLMPNYLQDPEAVGGVDKVVEEMNEPGTPGLPACPLMHGTGWFTANIYLMTGGSIVLLTERHLDIEELLDTLEREKVGAATIVGDAFARPMLKALDDEPDRWDLSSLIMISSSGVMWSQATKDGLLRHNETMMLIDSYSSSEAIGLGQSVSAAGAASETAHFSLGAGAMVFDDEGVPVQPGSGDKGRVAVPGHVPIGYYKDPVKSAETFITYEDTRYSMPGDYATVADDGTITLLGRGSVCINTAGEKVFPEEVEEALKTHEGIADAVVVGVPDDRFGEAITAVVEPHDELPDSETLIAHVKEHLAHYKAPRTILEIDTIGRAPNAKVDYKRLRQYALDEMGIEANGH